MGWLKLAVRAGNGIEIAASATYRLDPRRTVEGELNLVSHAHSDHLPSGGKCDAIVASEETVRIAELRTGRSFLHADDERVEMLEAGHIYGSRMFLIHEDATILYTGDFCTKQKIYLNRARPHRADVLIVECTYGIPSFRFPDPIMLSSVIREWVADALEGGRSVIFSTYALGKAQELTHMLSGMPLFADEAVLKHNRLLLGEGKVRPLSASGKEPAVYLVSSASSADGLPQHVKRGALRAAASGWFLDSRSRGGLDEAFPLSDHCDYADLMDFVARCSPTKVYTVHGYCEQFASSIRRELQIDAEPLKKGKGQARLIDY